MTNNNKNWCGIIKPALSMIWVSFDCFNGNVGQWSTDVGPGGRKLGCSPLNHMGVPKNCYTDMGKCWSARGFGVFIFFQKNTSDRSDRTHARKKMLKRSQEPVMFKKNTYLDGSYQTLGDRLLLLYSPYQYDGIGFHFSASLRTGWREHLERIPDVWG